MRSSPPAVTAHHNSNRGMHRFKRRSPSQGTGQFGSSLTVASYSRSAGGPSQHNQQQQQTAATVGIRNRAIRKRRNRAARRRLERTRGTEENDRFERRLRELSGPAFGNPCLVHDPIDLISLQQIWTEDSTGRRVPSNEVKYLFSYLEDGRYVRGFDSGSLQQFLRQPRPLLHPVSRKVIPNDVLERADKFINFLISKKLMTPSKKKDLAWIPVRRLTREDIRNLSLEVFQELARQSVVVDERTLLKMSKEQLVAVIQELHSMFMNNFTSEQRRQLRPPKGQPFAFVPRPGNGRVNATNLPLALAQYILRELRQILRRAPQNLKYMVSYVAVGALSSVDGELRARYTSGILNDSDTSSSSSTAPRP